MENNPAKKIILWLVLGICLAVTACGDQKSEPLPDIGLSVESVKALSTEIVLARIKKLNSNNPAYGVEIDIAKDPSTGSAQDWNAIALAVDKLSSALLSNPKVNEVSFTFWTTDSSDVDWAKVTVDRDQLPDKWAQLSYQDFFAYTHPKPGSVHSEHWLCDFYWQYETARPDGEVPDACIK